MHFQLRDNIKSINDLNRVMEADGWERKQAIITTDYTSHTKNGVVVRIPLQSQTVVKWRKKAPRKTGWKYYDCILRYGTNLLSGFEIDFGYYSTTETIFGTMSTRTSLITWRLQ